MKSRSHPFCFTWLLALYLLTSQVTVLVLVLQWYSTAAHQTVEMRSGAGQEPGELRWSPRTHLPLGTENDGSCALAGESVILLSPCNPLQGLLSNNTAFPHQAAYFSPRSNRAPPLL